MRATSKRLCFMASMARSNRTLSGCFEPTFARGLLTFLFVQAAQKSSAPRRITTEIRRDIKTSGNQAAGLARLGRRGVCLYACISDLQQCGFAGRLQQLL